MKGFFLLLLLLTFEATALEKSYFISKNLTSCDQSYNPGSGGIMTESADFIYDPLAATFTIEAVFSNESGATLANGFQFALTSENSTSFNHYKIPYFYVDGRDLGNVRVRAYTSNRYNKNTKYRKEGGPQISDQQFMQLCDNSPGSWDTDGSEYNPTEAIFPPAANALNPSWVLAVSAADSVKAGKTYRTFSLTIDTAKIASFVPNNIFQYVCNGSGCYNNSGYNLDPAIFDFTDSLTIDFIPTVISASQYSAGLISTFNISQCAYCKSVLQATNNAPECQSVNVTPTSVEVGSNVNIIFKFYDKDTELTDSYKIAYSGVPAGATASIPSNSSFSPASQSFNAVINFKPSEAEQGKNFVITPSLVQLYGNVNTAAKIGSSCIARFNVVGKVGDPVCQTKTQASVMSSVGSKHRKLVKLLQASQNELLGLKRKLKVKAPNLSSLIASLNSDAANILNTIPSDFNVCSENYGSCKQTDYFPYYKIYMDSLLQLYCKRDSVVTYCSGLNNVGAKIFKRLIELKALKLRRDEGLGASEAKRQAKLEVLKKYRKKASSIIKSNFSSVFTSQADGLHLNLEQFDFSCD